MEGCNSNRNQEIKRQLVARDVVCCVSMLVSELAKKAEEFPDWQDDLYNAYRGIPDYEEAAKEAGWRQRKDGTFAKKKETSEAEGWQELCDEQDIDAEEYAPEIYEHWIVSDWLASKLEEHGERVLRDFFGLTVWGRACTGQAILLDGVISEVCAEMEILEGQKYEWKEEK